MRNPPKEDYNQQISHHRLGQIAQLDLWRSDMAAGPQTQSFPGNPGPGNMYETSRQILILSVSHRSLGDDDEPEWMVEFAKRDSRRAIAEKRHEFEARLARIKDEEERLKQAQNDSERPRKKQVQTSIISFRGPVLIILP